MYVMGASSPVRVSGFVEYAQAEQYFRLLLETAPDAMVVIKHDSNRAGQFQTDGCSVTTGKSCWGTLSKC